jgi:hypothetical protein
MFTGVPYFCHSHLVAMLLIGATAPVPAAPVFNATALPPEHMARILSEEDMAEAYQKITDVSVARTFFLIFLGTFLFFS